MASAQTVSAAELRGKNLRHALVVDVRTPAEYAQKRLLMPTALAPVDALDPAAVAQRNGILPDTPVFTLCASGRRAQSAADKFLEAGFRNVRIIEGGIAACQEAGWPIAGQTESSGPPASIERQVRLVAGAIVTLCVLLGILAHPGFLFGALFVGAVFLSPLVTIVPFEAVAPAMVFVGFLMIRQAVHIDWQDWGLGIPAFMTIIFMPFAYSIADGIGAGFISYVFIRLVQGRGREVHWLMYVVSAVFLVFFSTGLINGFTHG